MSARVEGLDNIDEDVPVVDLGVGAVDASTGVVELALVPADVGVTANDTCPGDADAECECGAVFTGDFNMPVVMVVVAVVGAVVVFPFVGGSGTNRPY